MDDNIIVASPHVVIRQLEHSIDIEDKKMEYDNKNKEKQFENTWKSCCLIVDRRAVQYVTQIIIIIGVIIFCVERIITLNQCDGHAYMSLLAFLLGIILPGPVFK
jgi:hypothetical protein